ncbi:MAG: TonB-system energizer ExbB [Gammaproteobacteria bacterium]|nr:MAG: TonB-system energizer ExbB [Gammaproteobacteria bacterium]
MPLMDLLKTYTDYFIFGILALMSLIMLYKVLERSLFYLRVEPRDYDNIHALELDLVRGLTPVYTVGSTAPYVGLLGTVIGILITFYDMGQSGGDVEADKIMIGLALALKATAAGILVAIPSVMFYNALTAKVEAQKLAWQAHHS